VKKLVARRNRVLRARHVQHQLALVDAVRARDEVRNLETNADRLAKVRADLFDAGGMTDGGSFASYRELADRLERAGRQLAGAVYDAQNRADRSEVLRLAANREREIAERLKDRAVDALEAQRELRLQALPVRTRRAAAYSTDNDGKPL
jgi:hypothetical protein